MPETPSAPSPLQATLAWLLGMVLVVGVGLVVGGAAAVIAVSEGLPADAAFALIIDPRASPFVTSPAWISASIALNELALVVLMLFWWRRLRSPLGQIVPFARPSARALLGAVLLPFGFAPLAELAGELVHRAVPGVASTEHAVISVARGTSPTLLILVLSAAAVLPAVIEELMFRGFVTTAFRRYSPLVALIVPSFMFGAFHLVLQAELTQAAGTVVLGAAFGLVRLYTGSIWPCMLSHFAYNTGIILEARWLDPPADYRIYWGRLGVGLVLAVAAYALLVGDLGRRTLLRFGFRPPRARGGPV